MYQVQQAGLWQSDSSLSETSLSACPHPLKLEVEKSLNVHLLVCPTHI